jgi:hypothetical protein
MMSIKVGRYDNPAAIADGWVGWLEPADKSWILFVDALHRPHVYLHRHPATGAVLPDDPAKREEESRWLDISPHLADSWSGGPSRKPPVESPPDWAPPAHDP